MDHVDDEMFERIMAEIVTAIKDAGHPPRFQLYGYLKTGNDSFITRRNGARDLIRQLDQKQLAAYIAAMEKGETA